MTLSGCATSPKPKQKPVTPVIERLARQPGALYHTVRRGETLWSISRAYGVDLQALIKVNTVLYTGTIENGQVLLIPRAEKGYISTGAGPVKSVPGESFMWPARGSIAAPYGSIVDNVVNKGIDIRLSEGTGIKASRSGRVVFCDPYLKGFGKTVIIDHGDRYQTVYSYNSEILVNLGDQVTKNMLIARSGKTGRANIPTLHFEIRRDGEPQNPAYFLPH